MSLTISYDKRSDTLQIDWCEPYAEQDSRSIQEGVLARINPNSKNVESLDILDFAARFGGRKELVLSVFGSWKLA